MGERIEIGSGESALPAYRAAEKDGGPGVLVLHAWWGMTEIFTGLCDRLAEAGFVALVPDLYRGRTASTIAEAEELSGSLSWDQAQTDLIASAERLLADPQRRGRRIGAAGFSMGASFLMWLLSQQPALSAAVLFYGGADPETAPFAERSSASILGHFAETDPYEVPPKDVMRLQDDLRGAGKDITFHVYPGTGHWFFEANRPDAYDPAAAGLAWDRTLEFLHERLAS